MKNLFICHTQANLILASGLALGRFKADENILILFVDFGIKDELKIRLDKIFTRTLYLQSIYPAENNTIKAKLRWYPMDWTRIKCFLTEPVNRVFAVCDCLLLVQKTLQRCYKLNNGTEMAWLEDGVSACCRASDIHKGMDRYSWSMTIRRFIFQIILSLGHFYERDFEEMGGLKILKVIYTCYPDAVSEPYRSQKQIVGITDVEYLAGLRAMYPKSELNIKPNSVILVLDKLDRYKYPDKVQASIGRLKAKAQAEGKNIFCKFHPREDMEWPVFEGCTVLERTIGAESLYLSLIPQRDNISIVGIKSAGLMSAKKMGFDVTTLFNECGETNPDLVKFFRNMGCKFEY